MRTIEVIVAENIAMRLQILGMKTPDLAEKSGISRQSISKILNHQVEYIRLSTRKDIAKALQITVEELERDSFIYEDLEKTIARQARELTELKDAIGKTPLEVVRDLQRIKGDDYLKLLQFINQLKEKPKKQSKMAK